MEEEKRRGEVGWVACVTGEKGGRKWKKRKEMVRAAYAIECPFGIAYLQQ
jgi:hypothetical protein